MAQLRQNRTREISHLEPVCGQQTVFVDRFTNGILDPALPMLGPVRDGGHIVVNATPGCWGPMITPRIRGGHEVTHPVGVEGAEIGDAIAISIRDITVTSLATASGTDRPMEGRFLDDPFVAGLCPECGTLYRKLGSMASVRQRFVAPSVGQMQRRSTSPTATPWFLTRITAWV